MAEAKPGGFPFVARPPLPEDWASRFRDRPVLVTGGLGFIGSHLCRRLVSLGARVTVVDSLIPEYGGNLWNVHDIAERIHINISDIRDPHSMAYLVRDQDLIFNLAGQVSHTDSMTDPLTDLDINCRSQLSLLEACRRNNPSVKVVFAGTRQQYGRPQYLPVDEKHPLNPTDVNGINKAAGEAYHLLYSRVHGIRACSLRLTNTYGPGMLIKHERQGFFSVFLRRVLTDEEILIYGTGEQLRDLNYVEDVVDAFLRVAVASWTDGEVYNLGSHEVVSVGEVARLLVRLAGKGRLRTVPFPRDRERIDVGSVHASFEKIRSSVGWTPKVSLEEGCRRTLEYYRRHLEHYL
jgi:nucleoside-diphosphate-sugar epimerase